MCGIVMKALMPVLLHLIRRHVERQFEQADACFIGATARVRGKLGPADTRLAKKRGLAVTLTAKVQQIDYSYRDFAFPMTLR